MKKITAIICAGLILCGCTSGYIKKNDGDTISPVQDGANYVTSSTMPLYFRYYTEPMLIRNSVNIDVTSQQLPEYYAISALISGISGDRRESQKCFGKNTSLVSVTEGEGVLYVTLSDGFLTDTKVDDDVKTRENRKIALYSVVNTVVEMGSFSGVQFYLNSSSSSVSYRPDTYEMGLTDNPAESTVLGVITRNTSLILTPSNTVSTALNHYANRDWEKFYLYIGSEGTMPLQEELAADLDYLALTLRDISSEANYTVSDNGKTATVIASFRVRSENRGYALTDVPLKVINKNGVWLMDYDTFAGYLGVES